MKTLKPLLVFLLLIIVLSVSVMAAQSGTTQLIYFSNESGCLKPYSGEFTPGDTIHMKINFTNTGTEDLINAYMFIIDWPNRYPPRNYGWYTTPNHMFDVKKGESVTLCYPYKTFDTYIPGYWNGRIYFRNYNSVDMGGYYYYFNVSSHPTVPYEFISLSTNHSSGLKIPPGTKLDHWIDVTNLNDDAPFTGTYSLRRSVFTDTGTKSRKINLPAGGTQRFITTYTAGSEPLQDWFGAYIDGSQGQDLIRMWWDFRIEGDYYMYRVSQIFSNQSIYAPGEKGFISAYVYNYGTIDWDSSITYRFHLRGRGGPSSTWKDLYDKTFNFQDPPDNHQAKKYRWYYSDEFENTFDTVLTEFYAYLYIYEPDGSFMSYSCPYYAYYSPNAYPDRTEKCESDVYEEGANLFEKLECDAEGSSIIFVQKPEEAFLGIYSIKATQGSLTMWWEGERDGKKGYFIRGSTNAKYEIIYWLLQIMEMDAFRPILLLFLTSVVVFGFLLIIYKNNKKGKTNSIEK